MENKKIEINTKEGTEVLVLREGEAKKVYDPKKRIYTGAIDTAQRYCKHMKINPENAVILIDDNAEHSTIRLIANEKKRFSFEAIGQLEKTPFVDQVPLKKVMTIPAFRDWARTHRHLFVSLDANLKLTASLQQFTAKIDTAITSAKDTRGNSEEAIKKIVKTELQEDFQLAFPILKGGEKVEFKVDIILEAQGNGVVCHLESPELLEKTIKTVEALVNAEKKYFEDNGYLVIYATETK